MVTAFKAFNLSILSLVLLLVSFIPLSFSSASGTFLNSAEKTLKLKPDIGGITSSSGDYISEYDDTKGVKEERSHLTTNLEEIIEQKASFTDTGRSSELEANHMTEEGRTQTLIDAYDNLQADAAESNKYN